MSFEFEQCNEYEYDTDTECVVLTDNNDDPRYNVSFEAECSECEGTINLTSAVGKCPHCNRDIVDWKPKDP